MRMKLYNFLVNRHAGIRSRYHYMHDGSRRAGKAASWLYLVWLNFAYYILFCRFLGRDMEMEACEKKQISTEYSESEVSCGEIPAMEGMAAMLLRYDVVSFDIFDTLIFRPFSEPADLFYFVGEKLGYLDFRRIRMEQEWLARQERFRESGHSEVTFAEIWARMEQETGIPAKEGMEAELEAERGFCYANPYMLAVVKKLREQGKRMVAVSDMYLPGEFLEGLLAENGYVGIEKVYVSCAYGKSKCVGELFDFVKADLGEGLRYAHVGDNFADDVRMAKKHGFSAVHYLNVNRYAKKYRPYDMSPVVGGAYRGIVDNHLYGGAGRYSMEYEYGFVYGGLFVLGYCGFIHEYCRREGVDRLLFLSRDGETLKQAYDRMFPGEDTVYAYWSRKAGLKLTAGEDKHDYFRRFLIHKADHNLTLREILHAMELDGLAGELEGWAGTPGGEFRAAGLSADAVLTDGNVSSLRAFLEENWERVLRGYRPQREAAEIYFRHILSGCRHAAVVDIGWVGSGALEISRLVERVWRIPCRVDGLMAGTNALRSAEEDASEPFLQSGRLTAYLYSQRHNRDLWKEHDPGRGYNVFWEILLSSPTPQFAGFYPGGQEHVPGTLECVRDEGSGITLGFGRCDVDPERAREVRRGIFDFIEGYREHFREYPYMFRISGRDAYAPMLAALGRDGKYLREMEKRFGLEISVE